jgi:hypothetical protein
VVYRHGVAGAKEEKGDERTAPYKAFLASSPPPEFNLALLFAICGQEGFFKIKIY